MFLLALILCSTTRIIKGYNTGSHASYGPLILKAVFSSEMLACSYKSTWHYNPEDCHQYIHYAVLHAVILVDIGRDCQHFAHICHKSVQHFCTCCVLCRLRLQISSCEPHASSWRSRQLNENRREMTSCGKLPSCRSRFMNEIMTIMNVSA